MLEKKWKGVSLYEGILIIPAYNEEENILRTIASIETFKQEVTHFQHELDYVVIMMARQMEPNKF